MRTNWKKIAIVAVIFIAALIAVNMVYQRSKVAQVSPEFVLNNKDQALAELQQFEIRKSDLSEDQKKDLQDSFEQARKFLVTAIDDMNTTQNPDKNALLYWPVVSLGNVHRDAGDYQKAEKAFLLAYALQPKAFVPLGNLGELYKRYFQDYDKAEKYYLMAINIESDYLDTYYSELYEIYRYQRNNIAQAEQLLIDGVRKYPETTSILALLALHYRQTGQTDLAIERYNELLTKNPSSQVAQQALKELSAP